jgi:hypothetical protein
MLVIPLAEEKNVRQVYKMKQECGVVNSKVTDQCELQH